MAERYTVETIRAGQPRPYADSFYEYRITVERHVGFGPEKDQLKPWLMHGDVEARIRREEVERREGRMFGGDTPDESRKMQRDWAKKIVRALCCNFRERDDQDGLEGMAAHFAPTLTSLTIDPVKGEIRAVITEAYTD